MDKFWEALNSSILISGMLALGCLAIIGYLAVTGQEIPDVIAQAFLAIIGFFFGARTAQFEASKKVKK